MLWELFQMSRIEQAKWNADDANYSARAAQSDAKELQATIRVLEKQCEQLTPSSFLFQSGDGQAAE